MNAVRSRLSSLLFLVFLLSLFLFLNLPLVSAQGTSPPESKWCYCPITLREGVDDTRSRREMLLWGGGMSIRNLREIESSNNANPVLIQPARMVYTRFYIVDSLNQSLGPAHFDTISCDGRGTPIRLPSQNFEDYLGDSEGPEGQYRFVMTVLNYNAVSTTDVPCPLNDPSPATASSDQQLAAPEFTYPLLFVVVLLMFVSRASLKRR